MDFMTRVGRFTMRLKSFTKLQHSGEIQIAGPFGADSRAANRAQHAAELLLIGLFFAAGCRSGTEVPSGTVVQLPGLSAALPAGWQQVTPSSSMRVAQATIPGPGGPAELAVFYFGAGQGGSAEANLQRWIHQMTPDPGSEAERKTFESDGLRITSIDVHGTMQPGQMGMGPSQAQPDSRLLGAVVEGEGGPWFFKANGPEQTLGPQRDAFTALLHSIKLARGK